MRKEKSWKQRSAHTAKQQQTTTERKCFNCGGLWPHEQGKFCPARNKTCKACKKRGHFADVCRGKSQQGGPNTAHRLSEHSSDSDSDDQAFTLQRNNSKAPKVTLTIGDRDIDFIVDTGASVNVISHDTYSKIPGKPTLCGPVPKVFAYGSRTELPLLGKFSAELCYKDTKLRDTILVTRMPSESLSCFKSAEALGLVSIVYKVSPSQSI